MDLGHSKPKLRRLIGITDIILTTAIIIQIYFCIFLPIYQARNSNWGVGMWSFFGLSSLYSIIPILAGIALVMSTGKNVGIERALELIRFWMHCNLATVALVIVDFCIVLTIQPLWGKFWVLTSTGTYLCFRVIFTLIIWYLLNKMNPSLPTTLEKSETSAEDKSRVANARYKTRCAKNYRVLEGHELRGLSGPMLPLRPYRGVGLPNCQCVIGVAE